MPEFVPFPKIPRLRRAASGFMNPEGIIVYLPAAKNLYKVLLEKDDIPKGLVA